MILKSSLFILVCPGRPATNHRVNPFLTADTASDSPRSLRGFRKEPAF